MTHDAPDRILFAGPSQPDDLSSVVHEAIGAASICWENMSGTGVFNDVRARTVADEVIGWIEANYERRVDHVPESAPRPDGRQPVHRWDFYADPDDWSALVLACGGSTTSWTGRFLELVAKSDLPHLHALRRAHPRLVAAWEVWRANADGTGRGVLAAREAYDA